MVLIEIMRFIEKLFVFFVGSMVLTMFWGVILGFWMELFYMALVFLMGTFVSGVKMLWEITMQHEKWKENLTPLNGLYQMEREE
jgi:hypothetical protein